MRFAIHLTALLALPGTSCAETFKADVVVNGGTASGVIAALAAAREGKQVVLLEPGKHVGGMVSGGLGATDWGNRAAIGGCSREFFTRVHDYYVKKYGAASPQVKACSDGFHFEPHVAETIFRQMLAEAKVAVHFRERLDKVHKENAHIRSITTEKGNLFTAAIFIDASYEGDLMAAAGVKYTVGREAASEYGEALNGVRAQTPKHQFPADIKVDPFVKPRLEP